MLEIKNLHKTFQMDNNPANDKRVLHGLNFTLGDDDFVSVIGSNGSGKTTLLNLIAGTVTADEGQIILDGEDITKQSVVARAKHIGRVFQDPKVGTIGDISLFENLSIASRRGQKQSPFRWALTKKKREEFGKILKPLGLGLEDRLEATMDSFSGGQRQSITLLMASLIKPKLLLLDEHTAALDPKTAKTVMELTEKIVTENHIPTLMITHNMKDAIAYGNRLIMMSGGEIIFEASGEEKKKLTVSALVEKFQSASNVELPDSMVLR